MKKISRAGYTIVELLIVVAVTSVIAIGAFTVIRGQQAKNEFTQAVRDFEAKIADVANDVAKGYFPNIGENQRCNAQKLLDLEFTAADTDEQGASSDCTFAGKVMRFNADGDDTQVQILTIAARRETRNGKPVGSLDDLVADDMRPVPGIDEQLSLLYGLRAKSIRYNGANGSAIAFLTGFANRNANNTSFSGAPVTNLHWIEGTAFTQSLDDMKNNILPDPDNYTSVATGPIGEAVEICMEHGVGGRTALFTIGLDGKQLSTRTEIDAPC